MNTKHCNDGPQGTWRSRLIRGLVVLLFLLFSRIAGGLLVLVAFFQFFSTLICKRPNEQLKSFGGSLGVYLKQIAEFVSYNVDRKPWPFSGWPSPEPTSETGS
jgi:hypothetical protein